MQNEESRLISQLLDTRINDFYLASTRLPNKTRVLSKMFANTLGNSSGKILRGYDQMFEGIERGNNPEEVAKSVERLMNEESKVNVKLPLVKPKRARLCGLVALDHSGFFVDEANLYGNLINNLDIEGYDSSEDLREAIKEEGSKNPEIYGPILESKEESIHNFSVLMGINEDKDRFAQLTEEMPTKIKDYFEKVAALHKGGRLGISWPISFKKFSSAIKSGLQEDTTSYLLQEGIGDNFSFSNPEENRGRYSSILNQIRNSISKEKRTRMGALPTAYFYLNGLQAYAQELAGEETEKVIQHPDYLGPAVTATSGAYLIADENDHEEFITTWFMIFKSLV